MHRARPGLAPDAARRQALILAAILALAGRGAQAQSGPLAALSLPRPDEVRQLGPDARLQGQMRFRYWGFHVYDAQLWVRPGFDPLQPLAHPFALSLVYARALRAQDIAERSLEEIERQIELPPTLADRWRAHLRQALVDVAPGDRLTGLHQPQGGAAFFHNARPTAVVSDPAFALYFFGIWLSPQTSAPALRRALLRLRPDQERDRGT